MERTKGRSKIKKLLLVIAALLVATPVWAHADTAMIHSCQASLDSVGNHVEPVRTFANGAIRVAHVSTEEPAAASEHLLIYVRTKEGIGDDCFAVVLVTRTVIMREVFTLSTSPTPAPSTTIRKVCCCEFQQA
jgi:hypothetical protein